MARILIVEDEKNAREALGEVFSPAHDVRLAEDAEEGLAFLERETLDLVLTDIVLPGELDGLDLLERARTLQPGLPVIVMTAYGSVGKAVRAMRHGAHDFLEKPLDLTRLRNLVASTLRARDAAPASAELREDLDRGGVPPGFVGQSAGIRDVFRIVAKAAPTNATVLILGESGTGKELVAEAIHRASPRAGGPFIKVNCAALPEGLLESELFGHAKGSFTGATGDRTGRFEAATAAPCSSTRWARCPPIRRSSSCACSRTGRSSASERPSRGWWTCGSWRRPMPISTMGCARGASGRTSTSA